MPGEEKKDAGPAEQKLVEDAVKLLKTRKETNTARAKAEKIEGYNAQSGQYIVLAAEPDSNELTEISWSQGGMRRSAPYYRMRCWFGTQTIPSTKALKDKISGIVALDETFIFIASEYLEKRYRNVSVLKDKHLLERNLSEDERQIIARIDNTFHYGQFRHYKLAKTFFRWLVYHPPTAGERSKRQMFQHRFVENDYQKFSKFLLKAAKGASDMVDDVVPGAGNAGTVAQSGGNALIDVVSSKFGDALNQFGDPPNNPSEVKAEKVVMDWEEMEQQRLIDESMGVYMALSIEGTVDQVDQIARNSKIKMLGKSEETALTGAALEITDYEHILSEFPEKMTFRQAKAADQRAIKVAGSRREVTASGITVLKGDGGRPLKFMQPKKD